MGQRGERNAPDQTQHGDEPSGCGAAVAAVAARGRGQAGVAVAAIGPVAPGRFTVCDRRVAQLGGNSCRDEDCATTTRTAEAAGAALALEETRAAIASGPGVSTL